MTFHSGWIWLVALTLSAGCIAEAGIADEPQVATSQAESVNASPSSGSIRASVIGACTQGPSGMVCAGRTQTDYAHFSVPTGAGGGRITFSWDPVQGESEQMRVYLHDENGDPVQRAEGKSPLVIDVKKWHRTDYQLSTWFNTDVAGAVDQHVDWHVEIV